MLLLNLVELNHIKSFTGVAFMIVPKTGVALKQVLFNYADENRASKITSSRR